MPFSLFVGIVFQSYANRMKIGVKFAQCSSEKVSFFKFSLTKENNFCFAAHIQVTNKCVMSKRKKNASSEPKYVRRNNSTNIFLWLLLWFKVFFFLFQHEIMFKQNVKPNNWNIKTVKLSRDLHVWQIYLCQIDYFVLNRLKKKTNKMHVFACNV